MTAEISSVRKRKADGFINLLSYAVCEWFLMFLLFVDAAFSYLLMKFAWYCELDTPCLLCSRLDNGFGGKRPGFYSSLLCSNHREEISSLVSCTVHGKFADVRDICDECLMPIAKQNKSNSASYIGGTLFRSLMVNKQIRCSAEVMTCSCCSNTWRGKSTVDRLVEVNPIGLRASKAKVKPPLPHGPGCIHVSRRDSLKRLREKITRSSTHHITLSHVGYTKLKISSDSESEFPISEDDDGANTNYSSKSYHKYEHGIQGNIRRPYQLPGDGECTEKLRHQGFEVKPSTLDHPNFLDFNQSKIVNSPSSNALAQHSVRNYDLEESCGKTDLSLTTELISLHDGLPPPDVGKGSLSISHETSNCSDSLHMPPISVPSELLLCSVPQSYSDLTMPNQSNIEGNRENGDASGANHIEVAEGTSSDDAPLLEKKEMHHIDASTLAKTYLESSDRNVLGSVKIEEDRPKASTGELGLMSKETNHKQDEQRPDENSSSVVNSASVPLKMNDSMYRIPDGVIVKNAAGEDIVDQVRCQIEHERNCLSSLYKELEEERNAAAIAANEATAMITRLQKEKATLQLEALQCLRMMEEQADYMEELEKANDLLAEKDKELEVLEYELEFYRNNFPDISGVTNVQEASILDNRVSAHTETACVSSDPKTDKISRSNGNCKPVNSSVSNIEGGKIYTPSV